MQFRILPLRKAWPVKDDASALVAQDASGRMKVHTTQKLGPKQSITKEGYLLCEDVPLARTGVLLFGPNETPFEPASDGVVRIYREESEVFRPEFLASFIGKPAANDHPPEDIHPENWRRYSVGVVMNPRRGTGDLADFIVGDMLIYDAETIRDVQAGKREVSVGYEAEYDEIGPGMGRQYNMFCNHVALVAQGRCGETCAIGDAATVKNPQPHSTGDCSMKVTDKKTLFQRLRTAFSANDKKAIDETLEELEKADAADEAGALHIHLGGAQSGMDAEPTEKTGNPYDALEERVGGLEKGHSEIMDALTEMRGMMTTGATSDAEEEAGKKEEAAKVASEMADEAGAETPEKKAEVASAKDSAFFGDSFQETAALAEILVPGIALPVFDAKAAPKATFDALCSLRRKALDLAYVTPQGREAIDSAHGGKPLALSGMTCRDVRALFRAAGAVRKAQNGAASRASDNGQRHGAEKGGLVINTPAQLNEFNRKRYGTN